MSKVRMLRSFVNDRLTVAIEEICVVFERTITECEDEVCRLRAENRRQRRLLDVILKPEIRLYRTTGPLQISASEERVSYEQLDRSRRLRQEDYEFPLIKEQQEELFERPGETDVSEVTTLPPVKSENKDENPLSSELSQSQTEEYHVTNLRVNTSIKQMTNWEVDGVLEPDINLSADGPVISSYCSETENADDLKEVKDTYSCLNMLKSKKTQSVEGQRQSLTNDFKRPPELSQELNSTNQRSATCKKCEMSFFSWSSLMLHVRTHKQDCGLCGKHLEPSESLKHHIQAVTHRTCIICSKIFASTWGLQRHMKSHTGETPFSCPLCGKRFRQKSAVKTHMRSHTGDKPFSCTVCGKLFVVRGALNRHMTVHTGEKPFQCTVCGKQFKKRGSLAIHRRMHMRKNTSACTGK